MSSYSYDPRYDAFSALTLGGVGALGGLGYSLLNKKQRKNKLRNALIGAASLPFAYVGGKYLASKFMNPDILDYYNPIPSYVDTPIVDAIYEKLPNSARDKYFEANDAYWKADYAHSNARLAAGLLRDDPDNTPELQEMASKVKNLGEIKRNYDAEWSATIGRNLETARNINAVLGYGTLGAGIGLPALYLAHLNKKKKKKQQERLA